MENKLEIIFQNENLLVINKKSGMVVNRSETTNGDTLQDLLDSQFDLTKDNDSEFIDRSGIVHRLDKETSGALIIAKNSKLLEIFKVSLRKEKFKKNMLH